MATVATGALTSPGARASTSWTPFRATVVVKSSLSRRVNVVVEAGAVAEPVFLIVAVAVKLSPGEPDAGGFVSAVMVRSGSVAASAKPELPRSQPTTARPQPSHPRRFAQTSAMIAPRRTADFAPKRMRGTQRARQARPRWKTTSNHRDGPRVRATSRRG